MKIGVIILARTNFGRWPDKVLFPLCGKSIFEWVIIKSKELGIPVIVSTTKNIEDQILVDIAERLGAIVSLGNPDDRNERYAQAIIENKLDYFLSISPAQPFFDVEYTRKVIDAIIATPGYHSYSIGAHTCAVPYGAKAQQVIDNLDNPDRDQEIFCKRARSKGFMLYDHVGPELRNRYLFNYNIAFKIQAETHKRICDHIGHFPKNYDEIRKALLEIDFTKGIK